jgi:sugar/nucleoside kinase (ribokinase family)
VIAVIGSAALRGGGPEATTVGLAASIAVAAVRSGRRVELIGKVGDDPAGDAVLIALNRLGVGHVAILRDAAHPTPIANDEPSMDIELDPGPDTDARSTTDIGSVDAPILDAADVGLALRYLPELAVIVAVHQPVDVVREAAAASRWAETTLIVVVSPTETAPDFLADGVLVVAAEAAAESAPGAAIGRYAAAIDQGIPAQRAYDELMAAGATPEAGPGT